MASMTSNAWRVRRTAVSRFMNQYLIQEGLNGRTAGAHDDCACHSVNCRVFSDILEPCVFPQALEGHGSCSFEDLDKARPIVT